MEGEENISFEEIKTRIEKKTEFKVVQTATEIIVKGNGKTIMYDKTCGRYYHKGFGDQIDFVASDIFRQWYALIKAFQREVNGWR